MCVVKIIVVQRLIRSLKSLDTIPFCLHISQVKRHSTYQGTLWHETMNHFPSQNVLSRSSQHSEGPRWMHLLQSMHIKLGFLSQARLYLTSGWLFILHKFHIHPGFQYTAYTFRMVQKQLHSCLMCTKHHITFIRVGLVSNHNAYLLVLFYYTHVYRFTTDYYVCAAITSNIFYRHYPVHYSDSYQS